MRRNVSTPICHKSLCYKLWDKIPKEHWLLLFRWYSNLGAIVKWNQSYSNAFKITKGTRQGSLLSPRLFNIFIDDLLHELDASPCKVSIGECSFNCLAYADDITIMCTTTSGLQCLIDICSRYAAKWRFKFNTKKTKCMVLSGKYLSQEPKWFLNGSIIENVESLEILGVHFDVYNKKHVEVRTEKCKRSFYSMRDIGMAYPGCCTDVKAHLWNSICQPVLSYGCDAISLSTKSLSQLETVQSNLIKQSLGLSKRSKSTCLLDAMSVKKVKDRIRLSSSSLLRRIYCNDTPVKSLTNYFMSLYLARGVLIPGTLVHRIISYGLSPIKCIFNKIYLPADPVCGVTDSLKMLLRNENFIKPYSEEHVLSSLLTRSF